MTSNFQNLMAKVEESVAAQAAEAEEAKPVEATEEGQDNAEAEPTEESATEAQETEEAGGETGEESAEEAQPVSDKEKNFAHALRKAEKETRAERDARIATETENRQLKQALEYALSLQKQEENKETKEEVSKLDPLDPESHHFLVNKINDLQKQIANTQQDIKGTKEQSTFHAAMSQLATERAAFMAATPDLPHAVDHVFKAEMNKALMFGLSEEALAAAFSPRTKAVLFNNPLNH